MQPFRRLALALFLAAVGAAAPACGDPVVIVVPMERPMAVAFSPGGGQMAVGGLESMTGAPGDGVVALVDSATGKQWSLLRNSGTIRYGDGGASSSMNTVRDLAYSPDGKLLAVAAELGLKLWNPASGKETATLAGYGRPVGGKPEFLAGGIPSIAFSPDGKLLAATNSRRDRLVLWDARKREPVRELEMMGGGDVAFSKDGALLVAAGHLNSVHLWGVADAARLADINAGMGPLYGVAIDPAGKLVAAVGEGGEKIWRLETDGDGRWGFVDEGRLTGYGPIAPVRGVVFSPDGRQLVTYADSGAAMVYDAVTRRAVGALLHGGPCAFSPDGKRLAVAETVRGQRGSKSRVSIWTIDDILNPDRLAEQARKAASELVRVVASGRPDYDLQPRAMAVLGGPQAAAATPTLVAALANPQIQKKELLAIALGRLAANSPEAVAALAKAVREEPAADTRSAAAMALSLVPHQAAASALPALAEAAASDESPDVQHAALRALERLNPKAFQEALAARRVRGPIQPKVVKRDGRLIYQGRPLEEWIERLGTCFIPNEIFGRPSPSEPLAAIRAIGPDALPALLEALKSPRWELRLAAAAGLEALGASAAPAVDPLLEVLAGAKVEDINGAGAAADALAGILKDREEIPERLLELAGSDNLAVRLAAARAIGQLDPADPRGVAALKVALEASTTLPVQRPMMMGPGFLEQPPVTWLAKTLADDDAPAMHRLSAAVTLSRMKDASLKALPAMIRAVGAKDEAVSQSAAFAIKELGTKAIPALRDAVKSEEREPVRRQLAATLAGLGDDGRLAVAEVLEEKEADQLWWAGALGAAPPQASMAFQAVVRESLEKCGQQQEFTPMQPPRPPAFPRYEQPTALWSAKLLADLEAPRSLRMQAATQLLRVRGEEIYSVLPALLETLNKETDRTMQSQLANTIQRMGPQAIPPVLAAVDQAPSEEVRRELLRSLSGMGEEGRRELTQQLTNNAEYRKLFEADSTSSATRRQDKIARQLSSLERRAISAVQRTGRPLTNGNFAQGFEDWHLEGDGQEFHLFPRGGGMALTTFGERRGDAVTGRAFQCFKVPRDASSLEFMLHGGSKEALTYIALWNGTQRLGQASARNDNDPFRVSFDLTKQRGAVVTLEIVDNSVNAWGFIGAERFRIVSSKEIKQRKSNPSKFTFEIELRGKQGQVISGRVDTANDAFVITYWSGPADKTWTPLQGELPLTLYAYTPDGQPYDVPDNWNGKLSGWTFLLPPERDLTSLAWKEGAPGEFWKDASFGWGGLRNSAGKVVIGPAESDETSRFRYVPMEGNSASDIMFDEVKVTPAK